MGTFLTALMLSAGIAGVVYSQLGKRVGYSNGKQVWTLVAIGFFISFAVIMIIGATF